MEKKPVFDIFVKGALKGWHVGINYVMPNIILAYIVIVILDKVGLLEISGRVCAPVMAVFGLPGEAIMVILAALISMGGAIGVASSLISSGTLSCVDVTILLPAIFMSGAPFQTFRRLLNVSGVRRQFYLCLFSISIISTGLIMLVMSEIYRFATAFSFSGM